MFRILRTAEGTAAGLLAGLCMVCIGGLISSTWLGIILTVLLCLIAGCIVNGFEGTLVGLVTGLVISIYSDMVSQSILGISFTVLLAVLIGGIVGWETSHPASAHRN